MDIPFIEIGKFLGFMSIIIITVLFCYWIGDKRPVTAIVLFFVVMILLWSFSFVEVVSNYALTNCFEGECHGASWIVRKELRGEYFYIAVVEAFIILGLAIKGYIPEKIKKKLYKNKIKV